MKRTCSIIRVASSSRQRAPRPILSTGMPSRRLSREESWNSLHHSEASGDNADDGYSDVTMEDGLDVSPARSSIDSPTFPTISDVQRALHPLQATADRVGKQVEKFAENLDRLSNIKQHEVHADCRHVLPLVNAYKKIASDTVNHLGSMHGIEKQRELSKKSRRRVRSSSGKSTPRPSSGGERAATTTVEDLKRWEQEEHTWDLLSLILQVQYPIPDSARSQAGSKLVRPSKNNQVHRYSSEKEVWNSFLASDDLAWGRHVVVGWLQKSADKTGQNIEQVVEELEACADRGSGLWAHSWLFTKEAIKGQKRLRSWPKALDPDDPGLGAALLNSEKTKPLVTQLDPDAITRQGRSLEKQDHYFESAMWRACWEMVRRGKDWSYVREWCQERVEGWRATAMRGDPRSSPFSTPSTPTWQSRALWRDTCALAAKDGGIDEYENAVYGVLSGYLPSVQKVSRCWDDYLFAHYNSYLLHSFDRYVRTNFSDRVPKALTDKTGSFKLAMLGGQREQNALDIVENMKRMEATEEEAKDPFKMLQGSLIANSFDNFVFTHGIALAEAANAGARSKSISLPKTPTGKGSITARITTDDHDLLRMITHIIFILQDLGHDFRQDEHTEVLENIVVAYVEYLGKAGKQQLLPLYASRLSPQRSLSCLGRQLPAIQEDGERQTFIQLMKQYGINVPGVLSKQLQMIIADTTTEGSFPPKYSPISILEQSRRDAMALRQIQPNFIGDSITDDQYDLIHGFEWYLLMDGHWTQTMTIGALIYKHLLCKEVLSLSATSLLTSILTTGSHGLAAARKLSQTVSFSHLSLSKTKYILGRTTDISRDLHPSDDDAGEGDVFRSTRSHRTSSHHRPPSSSARPVDDDRELLLELARTFRDLENLLTALDALEEWKRLADEGGK